MAMEFGDASDVPAGSESTTAEPEAEPEPVLVVDEAQPAEEEVPELHLDGVEEEPASVSGGFDLLEAPASPGGSDSLPDEPDFEEEPLELSGDAGASSEPSESPEIVLDVESAAASTEVEAEAEAEVEIISTDEPIEVDAGVDVVEVDEGVDVVEVEDGVDVVEVDAGVDVVDVVESEPAVEIEADVVEVSADEAELEVEEMEVIAFEVEDEPEPAVAAEESAALLGALGEDIDSLIDSIIDDVGSSAAGEEITEDEPPTHIPLFSDLTTPEFIDVAILLVRRVLKPGEVAVKEGDPGDSMFIISTGEVRATVSKGGQQLPVATLRDGDFFGEMAVLSGEPRTATVTAVKNTEVLELSRDNLQIICSRHPHVEAKIRLAYDERVSNDQGR